MTAIDMGRAATQPGSQVRELWELVDRYAIADLVGRLGLWLDEKLSDDARSLFTDDATANTPGGVVRGLGSLVDQARRNHSAFERTQHAITTVLIDLDGDRATVQANLIATFVRRADMPGSHVALGGRYRFEAVRAPEGWRFSWLDMNLVWASGG